MQCDMQGVRTYGDYRAPTAFYYQITPNAEGYELSTGMHREEDQNPYYFKYSLITIN